MDSDPVAFPPRLGGDFSGDEKMPEIGSRPCSSYTPLSASVMPVFLCNVNKYAPSLGVSTPTFLEHRHCSSCFRGLRVSVQAPCLRELVCKGVNARVVAIDASLVCSCVVEGADNLFGFGRDVNERGRNFEVSLALSIH